MNNALMFSSATDEWATPQALFDLLNGEFAFTLDAAASAKNRKCERYLGPDHPDELWRNALTVPWVVAAIVHGRGAVWCNPPYSRGLQGHFIAKAAMERRDGCTSVLLLPARTDTKAFHAHIYDASKWQPREGIEIRFLPGRVKFVGASHGAPFPSMVVVFRP